jgi:hypothetical protein
MMESTFAGSCVRNSEIPTAWLDVNVENKSKSTRIKTVPKWIEKRYTPARRVWLYLLEFLGGNQGA